MSTSTVNASQVVGKNPHEAQFNKVIDGRKRRIRGLWKRNTRFYAQLTGFAPATSKSRVQRISLMDKQEEPVDSVAQAVAGM
ncbi:MAG: hypothetical protein WCS94_06500 [Verrucomicrobiota bacterium]